MSGLRVMLVDDSLSIRTALSCSLENFGYQTTLGQDGAEALKLLQEHQVDLIITDLNMPNMNGIQLIHAVRSSADEWMKYLPILVLTTESQDALKNEARSAGATGWITKPVKDDQLHKIIQRVIR